MCDYCDCRTEPEIAALSAEHEAVLALTGRLRRAVASGEGTGALAAELADVLGPHAEREERGVFAALRGAGVDGAYLDAFEAEHRTIDVLLERAGATTDALALAHLLEAHVLAEESDLFPAAHQLLVPEDWEGIAHRTTEGAPA